ncbi:MAG: translation initiation factor IF-2 subunit alpha [Nanobdellota archaeon]
MLYQKEGMPEEGEFVMCLVTKVQHHSVFVKIEDYGKTGMIHISEIAPGRIRNIRDYVMEGKVVVCKVLRVNEARGHIDLSLRRVNEGQRKEKVNERKHEQKAEKIIEFVAGKLGTDKEDIFKRIQKQIFSNYPNVFSCFQDVINDDQVLEKIGFPEDVAGPLKEVIKQRIKPPSVSIDGKIRLISYNSEGVEDIKEILGKVDEKEKVSVSYLGAGAYSFSLTDSEYKSAEKRLKAILDEAEEMSEEKGCQFSFERAES